mgnify:CR=1 FL=1
MENLFKYGITCSFNDVPEMWPITLRGSIEEVCAQASEIGYDALEPQICDPQLLDADLLKKTADEFGLKYAAIATGRELLEHGLWMTSDDAGLRRASIDKLKLHIDLCSKLGAMLIVGSMRKNVSDISSFEKDLKYHDEAVYELADYAQQKGVDIVIENITIHISNWMNTILETANYVRHIGRDNVKIHLDSYSMLQEDNDIAGCYRECGKDLAYVHFTDGSRLYPGGSNVDFKAHMHAMLDIGYDGYVSIECRPYPDPYRCAKFSLDYLKALEQIVKIERYRRERPAIL